MDDIFLAGARVLSGLLAGTYLAFVVAVLPALRTQSDAVFTTVMNRISEVIVNPVFLTVFFGAPVAAAAALFWRLDGATLVALTGALVAFVVTIVANIPLNRSLAAGGSRTAFERSWGAWHGVRTLAATVSFIALSLE